MNAAPPLQWEASPPADASPGSRLSAYTHWLYEQIAAPLEEPWSELSPEAFAAAHHQLRESITRLYEYANQSPALNRDQKLYLRFFPESALQVLRHRWEQPDGYFRAPEETVARLAGRPKATDQYDQLYCTPDSTERRVQRILRAFDSKDAKVLFLGDDDLGSVALAPHFSGQLHVLDIDDRILEYVGQMAPDATLHKYDLIHRGLPQDLYEYFDAVVLDPPWGLYHCWDFLHKAIFALKATRSARIYLSFCPLQLELQGHMHSFWRRLARLGFTCEAIVSCFNLYDLDTVRDPHYNEHEAFFVPEFESPLMDLLRQVPYTFAHLYELRRLDGMEPHGFFKAWFRWWHSH